MNAMPSSRVTILAALMFQASTASAMTDANLDALLDLDLEDLMTIKIFTASKSVQNILDTAAPVTVVTAEDIARFGYRSLGDILRAVPGLHVSYDRSYQYLGVRGINRKDFNQRILLLLDGQRLNENMFDSAYIERTFPVDPEVIDRVEFVAGPGSSLYGNNAMLGVVNVITKSGKQIGGAHLSGDVGNAGAGRLTASYGKHDDNGGDLMFSVSSFHGHGRDWSFPEQGGSADNLDAERTDKLFAKLAMGEFNLSADIAQRTKKVPTAPYGTVFNDPDARLRDRQAHLSVSHAKSFDDVTNLFTQLNFGAYDFLNAYHYGIAVPDPLNNDEVHGRWWSIETRIHYSGLKGHQIVAGIEYQANTRQDYINRDVAPAYTWYEQAGDSHRYGLFVNDHIRVNDNWQMELGARFDRFSIQGALTDCYGTPCVSGPFSQKGDAVSPRAALIYKPEPDTVLKLLYGSAFRAANPTEIAFIIPGEPVRVSNADPEKLTTRELTIEHFPSRNIKLWANAFHYDFEGLIDFGPDNEYINAQDFRSCGVLLGGEWKSHDGYLMRASYTYADVADASGARMDDAPRHQAKLQYAMPLGNAWSLGIEALHTGSRRTLAGNSVDAYTLLNATLNSGTRWKNLRLSASIYNLLDTDYADPARSAHDPIDQIPQDGRGWRAQLDYRF